VGVVRTVVHVHVLDEATADTVLGEHTFHNVHEQGVHTLFLIVLFERFLHEHFGSSLALTAGIAGVARKDGQEPGRWRRLPPTGAQPAEHWGIRCDS